VPVTAAPTATQEKPTGSTSPMGNGAERVESAGGEEGINRDSSHPESIKISQCGGAEPFCGAAGGYSWFNTHSGCEGSEKFEFATVAKLVQ